MKNIRILSENFQFLVVKFSIYLNRRVFVMFDSRCASESGVCSDRKGFTPNCFLLASILLLSRETKTILSDSLII